MQHDWTPSTLGHGETMCKRCFITNREAAVLGKSNDCDVPPKTPQANNDNAAHQEFIDANVIFDDEDEDGDDEHDDGEDCGRWNNGRLSPQCSKAGSEECDWICPIGLPR